MKTLTLQDLFASNTAPGVYRTRSHVVTLQRAVEEHGWRFFHLDGHIIRDKASLLDAAAHAMAFPASFGKNWDALFDSMCDLSWAAAPGYVLFYNHVATFADAHHNDWEIAAKLFADVTQEWQANQVPFYILLQGM